MIRIFKSVDKKLEEIGLKKQYDKNNIVLYIRDVSYPRKYRQAVVIIHKDNGETILQSYDVNLYDDKGIGNSCVGLTYYELKLLIKKMKQKGWNKKCN